MFINNGRLRENSLVVCRIQKSDWTKEILTENYYRTMNQSELKIFLQGDVTIIYVKTSNLSGDFFQLTVLNCIQITTQEY